MTLKKTILLLLLCVAVWPADAQRPFSRSGRVTLTRDSNRFAWEYDTDFRYIFDNREFTPSHDAYIPSGTLNVLVLAPTVGFSVQQSGRVHHRIAAGVELAHDMGSQTWAGFVREPLIWYDAHIRTRRGVFEGLAGIFPRRFLEGAYTEAFFSGMYRDTNRNVEGLLLKWRSQRFFAELGCDWMGQYGHERRERFQVMSFGRWDATPWLALGWSGSFYHFACSEVAPNVVDNHLAEAWLKLDLAYNTSWQELSLRAGALAGYQCDRGRDMRPIIPRGGDIILTARRWNVALQNETWFGSSLLPMRSWKDPAGKAYATDLYFCSPCYDGFYDRLELAWTPSLNRYLSMRIAARAHFGRSGYLGWQQQFSLRFSLDALRHRDTVAGRCL